MRASQGEGTGKFFQVMETQMEKQVENEATTGIIGIK